MLPFITEECWSWSFAKTTDFSSIHTAPYPTAAEFSDLPELANADELMDVATACAQAIRKIKSEAKLEYFAELPIATLYGHPASIELLNRHEDILSGVLAATRCKSLTCQPNDAIPQGQFRLN